MRPIGLFGNKEEKAAEEAAGAAAVERLNALSTDELAVELMPAFGEEALADGSVAQRLGSS